MWGGLCVCVYYADFVFTQFPRHLKMLMPIRMENKSRRVEGFCVSPPLPVEEHDTTLSEVCISSPDLYEKLGWHDVLSNILMYAESLQKNNCTEKVIHNYKTELRHTLLC